METARDGEEEEGEESCAACNSPAFMFLLLLHVNVPATIARAQPDRCLILQAQIGGKYVEKGYLPTRLPGVSHSHSVRQNIPIPSRRSCTEVVVNHQQKQELPLSRSLPRRHLNSVDILETERMIEEDV